MKLIVPVAVAVGISSSEAAVKNDCKDLSNMEGMKNCIMALVSKDRKDEKSLFRYKNEVNGRFIDIENDMESTESSDSMTETTETPVSCPEESPRMNGVPEFLKTPKARPEGGDSIMWIASDYHYYMNCVDEVEMRIWDDFQNRNETLFGPPQPYDIPPVDYYRFDPRDGSFGLSDIVNSGFEEAISYATHPWKWSPIDHFYMVNGAHGREMLSWKGPEQKEYWAMRRTWYKPEMQDIKNYIDPMQQNAVYRYCSGLPTFKRIWGSPIREDGCNPKYPYTSWHDEGLNTKAADCDAAFNHVIPSGFVPEKIQLDGGNCFTCGYEEQFMN